MYVEVSSFPGKGELILTGHLGLWEVGNNGPPATRLHIIREPVSQPVPDQTPAGDEVWSQVPDYGYWAE